MFVESIGASIALQQIALQDLAFLGVIGALAIIGTLLILFVRWELVVLRIAFALLTIFFVGFPFLRLLKRPRSEESEHQHDKEDA